MKKLIGILAILAVIGMTGNVFAANEVTDSDGTAIAAGATVNNWVNTGGTALTIDVSGGDIAGTKGVVVGETDDTVTTISVNADADTSVAVDSGAACGINIKGGASAGITINVVSNATVNDTAVLDANGATSTAATVYIASTANGKVDLNVTSADTAVATLSAASAAAYVFVDDGNVDNTITLTGDTGVASITGIVDMGGGTNIINITGADAVTGLGDMVLASTTDNDTVTMNFKSANVETFNKVDLANSGTGTTTTLILDTDNGGNAVTITNDIVGGDGSDTLTIKNTGSTAATSITSDITMGKGANSVTLNADAAAMTVTGTVTLVTAAETTAGTLSVNASAQTVTIGDVAGGDGTAAILGADGADSVTFSASTAGASDVVLNDNDGALNLNGGADTLTISGDFTVTDGNNGSTILMDTAAADAQNGADTVNITAGTLTADDGGTTVSFFEGDDTLNVTATGAVTDTNVFTFDLHKGADTVTMDTTSAAITLDNAIVKLGNGADTVNLTAAGTNNLDAGVISFADNDASTDTINVTTSGTATATFGTAALDQAAASNVNMTLTGSGGKITVDTALDLSGGSDGNMSITATGNVDFADITTDGGNDTIDINLTTANDPGTIVVGAGNDSVKIVNSADAAMTVTAITLTTGTDTDTKTLELVGDNEAAKALTVATLTFDDAATQNVTVEKYVSVTNATVQKPSQVTLKSDAVLSLNGGGSLAGAKLVVNADSGTVFGKITTDGADAIVVDANTTVEVLVNGYIADGTTMEIIDNANGATIAANETAIAITDNSAVLSFSKDSTDDNEFVITAVRTGYDTAVTALVDDNEGAALSTLTSARATATGDVATMLNTLDTYTTAQLADAAAQLSPESVATSTVDAGVAAATAYVGGVQGHTATMRNNATAMKSAPIGPAGPTAAAMDGIGVWADTYGTWGDQDERDGKMGYEYDTYGGVVGIDKTFGNALVGLSFGYSETDVDADHFSESDIDTYNLGIYGTYTMGSLWFDGGFSYAWGDIENDRKVQFLNRTASSDTESDTWTLYGGLGYDFVTGNWTLTPNLMLKYSDYDQDDYTEKGAAGANLHVNDFSQDSFTSSLGLDVAYQIKQNLKAKFRAAWVHEYCDNQSTIKANFANAQTFKTEGLDPADDSGIFGIGIEGEVSQGITAYLDYDYELKDDFNAHNVTAGMRFDF